MSIFILKTIISEILSVERQGWSSLAIPEATLLPVAALHAFFILEEPCEKKTKI